MVEVGFQSHVDPGQKKIIDLDSVVTKHTLETNLQFLSVL